MSPIPAAKKSTIGATTTTSNTLAHVGAALDERDSHCRLCVIKATGTIPPNSRWLQSLGRPRAGSLSEQCAPARLLRYWERLDLPHDVVIVCRRWHGGGPARSVKASGTQRSSQR